MPLFDSINQQEIVHMRIIRYSIAFMIICTTSSFAQIVEGTLSNHADQTVSLIGFDYYQSYELARDTIDASGHFKLIYDTQYRGMGILKTADNSTLILCLTEPFIKIEGTHLNATNDLQFIESPKNQNFLELEKDYGWHSQVYDAWHYLSTKYEQKQGISASETRKEIAYQISKLEALELKALNTVSPQSYLHWFLPLKKLATDVPKSIQHYTERISKHIKDFRAIDYSNTNFKTSGLFKELIEGHYFMLENMGLPLDKAYLEMNKSTDHIIANLEAQPEILNMVAEKLLRYFEQRSLFPAAAYLSEQLLSDSQCQLEIPVSNAMQKYHILKIGNKAPEIELHSKRLNDYEQPVLLVFGASWCDHCKNDLEKLKNYYPNWLAKKQLAVVYISLDTDKAAYTKTYGDVPWDMFCDYKSWHSKAAQDYFINATPTYVLIAKDGTILEHPRSLAQVDAWVTHKLQN